MDQGRTPEMLWEDVLFTLALYRKQRYICPVLYALQDYCKAAGVDLALLDLRFWSSMSELKGNAEAHFYKDNTHYSLRGVDLEEAKKNAAHTSGKILIVPVSIGLGGITKLMEVGADVYADNPNQCRGYDLSLISDK